MVVVVDWNAVCCAPRLHLPLGSMQCCSLVWGKNAYREEDEVAGSMWLMRTGSYFWYRLKTVDIKNILFFISYK
jgi:hypothetical protein